MSLKKFLFDLAPLGVIFLALKRRWNGKDWNKIGCNDTKFCVVISAEIITVIAVVVLSSTFCMCMFVCGDVEAGLYAPMYSLCASGCMMRLCGRCRCVLWTRTWPRACFSWCVCQPDKHCLIVCLPWRTFYQTFVCKQISIKLSAFCNHIAYACVSARVWECLPMYAHTVNTKRTVWATVVESICLVFKTQCISEQIIYHYASLCVLMDNSD